MALFADETIQLAIHAPSYQTERQLGAALGRVSIWLITAIDENFEWFLNIYFIGALCLSRSTSTAAIYF
ncbi:MAG: hypothetical protein OEU36_25935, partial [Gammaproteobacteria bacterium]|nr:hypothetical protein [Gammaproteobacteria bacterium]